MILVTVAAALSIWTKVLYLQSQAVLAGTGSSKIGLMFLYLPRAQHAVRVQCVVGLGTWPSRVPTPWACTSHLLGAV